MDDLNYNNMVGTPVSQLKQKQKPKYNIGQLAKNMELDLQKNNYSDNENNDNNSSDSEEIPIYKNKKQYKKITNNFYNFKDYDIIIISIIFLLLNINYSINFLNDYLIYFKNIDISYINVTIRSIIFAILFYLIKKFI
jgi:hypothetical protein